MAVHQRLGCFCYGLTNFRVTVSKCGHIYATGKVQVYVAINISQRDPVPPRKDHRAQADLAGVAYHVAHTAPVVLL